VSALFTDLYPPAGGTVSWKQLDDRVAVTYEHVIDLYTDLPNSFQIELFFDGRIRLTYLDLAAKNGLIGLSRGLGVPPDFIESDFTSYGMCAPRDADGDLLATRHDRRSGWLRAQGRSGAARLPRARYRPVELLHGVEYAVAWANDLARGR